MTRAKSLLSIFLVGSFVLAGCSIGDSDSRRDDGREIDVPKNSEIVAEGNGDLSYKARADGVIYVYDVDSGQTVFRESVREGQRFTVSPEQDLATLDGERVWKDDLKRKNTHRLYFEKE